MRDNIQVPAFNIDGSRMTTSQRILAAAKEVMAEAEELGGPEGVDYDILMCEIAEEARLRIEMHRIAHIPPLCLMVAKSYRAMAEEEESVEEASRYLDAADRLEGCRSVEEAAPLLYEAFEVMSAF